MHTLEGNLEKLEAALEESRARLHNPDYPVTEDDVAAAELRVENVRRRLAKAEVNRDAARAELRKLTSGG